MNPNASAKVTDTSHFPGFILDSSNHLLRTGHCSQAGVDSAYTRCGESRQRISRPSPKAHRPTPNERMRETTGGRTQRQDRPSRFHPFRQVPWEVYRSGVGGGLALWSAVSHSINIAIGVGATFFARPCVNKSLCTVARSNPCSGIDSSMRP